jgi:predicted NBD/HSP70 family sugar kinase
MRTGKEAILAIDIGGSKLVTGLVGYDGSVVYKEKWAWDKLDAGSVLRTIINTAKSVLENNKNISAAAAGVNIPGLADTEKGLWIEACFSGIRNVPIGDILAKEFGIPVFIDNDANNCALAEKAFGVCKDCTDFIWLTVSNGCGAALFLDNRIYRGIRGTAGEIGHICVEENNGYRCGCGNYGCLEAQAAGPGIARRYSEMVKPEGLSAKEIAVLARKGVTEAADVYRREGYYLGKALAAAINTLNPEKVVVGGGVSDAFDLFYPDLADTVNRMTYRKASSHVSLEKTGLGYDAALIGAAALALSMNGGR